MSIKETPMEDVIKNILDESDNSLTYNEVENKIHLKTQEAIRLLRSKGNLEYDDRVDKINRRVMMLSQDYNEGEQKQ